MTRLRQGKPLSLRLDADNTHLANLCGPLDENLRQIADGWKIGLARRGNQFTITAERAQDAARALRWFHDKAREQALTVDDIQMGLVELGASRIHASDPTQPALDELPPLDDDIGFNLRTRRSDLRPRTPRQRDYLNNILRHDITFGIGPAGTGKTWLAVACAGGTNSKGDVVAQNMVKVFALPGCTGA